MYIIYYDNYTTIKTTSTAPHQYHHHRASHPLYNPFIPSLSTFANVLQYEQRIYLIIIVCFAKVGRDRMVEVAMEAQ